MNSEDIKEALELLSSWGCKFEDTVFYEIYCKPNKNKIMKVEDLKNTKIYLSEEDERVKFQNKVFNLGVKWKDGTREVKYTQNGFYYINDYLQMTVDDFIGGMSWFLTRKNKRIFLYEVLNIDKPKEECKFKPFDRVLVRDNNNDRWMPREFSWYDPHPNDSHPFEVTDGSFYKYCIPYEGNEHLVGTINSK